MDIQQCANVFKALSEPLRLRILNLLIQHGELCVCDIISALDIPQSVVSRHLAYLRKHHLILARRDSVWIYYRIAQDGALLKHIFKVLKLHANQCDEYQMDIHRHTIANNCC